MTSVRFTDVQARPTECLDVPSVTRDEFQQLVPPVEAAFHAQMAAGGRRGCTLGKGEDGLLEPWAVCQGYDTCCLPHASFRQPLPQPEPPTGTGSAQRWRRA